ncbi:unnamed protein product [Durusdinium trenchii]|uniref:CSD domain-containing protein n=2 Tax=Durusdinium trenchii TaxID=1381693 RepID=A0ABP0SPL6_9DINO
MSCDGADLETPIVADVDGEACRARDLRLQDLKEESAEEFELSFFGGRVTHGARVKRALQVTGLLLLGLALFFCLFRDRTLIPTMKEEFAPLNAAELGANATENATINEAKKEATKEKEAPKDCHTAVPGDSCYGAVLWHKWIGLIEQPFKYNITRQANRHTVQEWLWQNKQAGCQRPCPGEYPVPTVPSAAAPRIYCFSVARGGEEMDAMFMQRQSGTGIFGCNGYDVYSDQSINIDGYMTKLIPSTAAGVSVDQTAANSQVFMKTWLDILNGNFWYTYDFLAKVDPDAVLFADRLRWHVQSRVGQNVFFLNCAVHAPAMYGAVEVFSKASLGAYKDSHARCEQSLPFWSWGEDRYMQECLKMLGVVPISDYNNNVRDARCWGSDCGNKGAVAFHAYKTVNSWYHCYLASA